MDCRIGQHRAEQLLREINSNVATGLEVPKERWDRLAVLCDRWQHNADGAGRAEADLFVIFVTFSQGKYPETLDALNGFFRQYYESDKTRMMDQDYKDQFAAAYMLAGHALSRTGRQAEALGQFRAVLDLGATSPPLRFESKSLPLAHYQVCRMLKETGAPRAELDAALSDFAAACPGHRYVESAQRLCDRQ
jgi:hypothetical protein